VFDHIEGRMGDGVKNKMKSPVFIEMSWCDTDAGTRRSFPNIHFFRNRRPSVMPSTYHIPNSTDKGKPNIYN